MNDFTISLLGDGIFDRWGDDCEELQDELTRLYSHSSFTIENHGLTGSRVGNALWRVTANYEKDGVKKKNLAYCNPDVVVVESFAYTQFWDGPEGLGEYRDLLRRIWDELDKASSAKRLFCLAPPPIRDRFMEGIRNFQNTSKAQRGRFADGVKMYLDEAQAIADDEGWPAIDINEEVMKRVNEGHSPRRFVDNQDHVHLSKFGFEQAARAIVRGIDMNRFIEERIAK